MLMNQGEIKLIIFLNATIITPILTKPYLAQWFENWQIRNQNKRNNNNNNGTQHPSPSNPPQPLACAPNNLAAMNQLINHQSSSTTTNPTEQDENNFSPTRHPNNLFCWPSHWAPVLLKNINATINIDNGLESHHKDIDDTINTPILNCPQMNKPGVITTPPTTPDQQSRTNYTHPSICFLTYEIDLSDRPPNEPT